MDEIGSRLREARMRAKIDINQVEAQTKIRAKYLRAMENEEWSLLPGEIYARTFLRSYADYLGLDSRELVDEYRRQYERPTDHDLRPLTSGRERERRGGAGRPPRGGRGLRISPWAAVVVVLVLVGVALYVVGTRTNNNPNTTAADGHAAHHSHKRHHKPRHTHPRRHHKPAPKTVRLALHPTGDVYVCLVDGDGRKLIAGVDLSPGQAVPPHTARTLLLTLGNNAITVTANGKPVPIAASTSPIGIKFTPTGHSPLPAAKQPQC